jgi:demethylmenaquinone methyltransferase/2-methoxy-6-polyprenyl-1,4-benzoquinol methylase
LGRGDHALDVATGTGDMARELARRVGPSGSVLGIDIADSMLELARAKTADLPVTYRHGDILQMRFAAEFDAAVVAFGFRNFADRAIGIQSMTAALKPGGRLVVLELVPSEGHLKPVIELYEQRIIPMLGRLVAGTDEAYRYLPQSVAASATAGQIAEALREAGLTDVTIQTLNLGTVALVAGAKPG